MSDVRHAGSRLQVASEAAGAQIKIWDLQISALFSSRCFLPGLSSAVGDGLTSGNARFYIQFYLSS
jgi:hypothetical protein